MLCSLPAPPSSHHPSDASLQLLEQVPELVPELVRGGDGEGGGGGAGEGGGGEDDPEDPREPQSEQSVPRLQMLYSLPAPPSSQYPSNASLQLLEQDPELVPELVHSAVIRASRL